MDEWRNWLPMWAHDSLDLMLVALQVGGIVLVAWLLRRSVGKLFDKIVAHHKVPVDVAVPMKTIGGWVIIVTAGMLVLERLGVSGQVLWTAITGFAAVAAVAPVARSEPAVHSRRRRCRAVSGEVARPRPSGRGLRLG